jgi:hypothetical protein
MWHTLALSLGGRTVRELKQAMGLREFQDWMAYYRDYPFDDAHRYYRPAALISQSMDGGDIKQKIEWLQPEPVPEGINEADLATMRALGVRAPAKG